MLFLIKQTHQVSVWSLVICLFACLYLVVATIAVALSYSSIKASNQFELLGKARDEVFQVLSNPIPGIFQIFCMMLQEH